MGFLGLLFTWSNRRSGDDLVQEGLDRGVRSFEWQQMFPNSYVHHLDLWFSDHMPLIIDIMDVNSQFGADKRMRRFHFKSCWHEQEACKALVRRNWVLSGGPVAMDRVVVAISKCTSQLSRWNVSNHRQLSAKIDRLQKEISDISLNIHVSSWSVIMGLEVRLDCLMVEDKDNWRQRSRVDWLKWGDQNMKFFHLKASGWRARNVIHGLFNDKGDWCVAQQDLVGVVVSYFSQLF